MTLTWGAALAVAAHSVFAALQPRWRVRNALDGPSAIGDDGLTGHVGRFVAGEIAHDIGDFLRGGEALHRHARHHPILLQRSVRQSLIDQLGSGEARRDRIDPNAGRGDFKRKRPGQAENSSLCRAIRAPSRQPDERSSRCDADDRAAFCRAPPCAARLRTRTGRIR